MKILVKQSKKIFLALLLVVVSAMAQETVQVQETVSDTELGNFANAVISIQAINTEAQSTMMEVISESSFDLERFNEVYQASMTEDAETLNAMNEEETKSFEAILERFEAMQAVFQNQMEDAIVKEGIDLERFDVIAEMIENDPTLQTRLQTIMEP